MIDAVVTRLDLSRKQAAEAYTLAETARGESAIRLGIRAGADETQSTHALAGRTIQPRPSRQPTHRHGQLILADCRAGSARTALLQLARHGSDRPCSRTRPLSRSRLPPLLEPGAQRRCVRCAIRSVFTHDSPSLTASRINPFTRSSRNRGHRHCGQGDCALRDAVFPPERRPDMLPASHESLTRGHRVRESSARTARCAMTRVSRSTPHAGPERSRMAAATLAPLLADERWRSSPLRVSPLNTVSWPGTCSRVARARARPFRFRTCSSPRASRRARQRCSSCTTIRAAIRHQARTMRDSRFGWRRRPTSSTSAARSPDRRRRRPLLQLPRSRNTQRAHRGRTVHDTTPGHHSAGLSGVPQGRQASALRSDPFGAGGLDGPSGPPRIGNYVMAGMHPTNERTRRKERRNHVRPAITPSIEVTIGRETRLYHAFITTAPARLDAPATVTLHTGPLSDVSGMAAKPISLRRARRCLGAARARGRHRTGLAARTISRTGLSLRARGSRARWLEHAAAVAVESDRCAGDGPRTRKRIAAYG